MIESDPEPTNHDVTVASEVPRSSSLISLHQTEQLVAVILPNIVEEGVSPSSSNQPQQHSAGLDSLLNNSTNQPAGGTARRLLPLLLSSSTRGPHPHPPPPPHPKRMSKINSSSTTGGNNTKGGFALAPLCFTLMLCLLCVATSVYRFAVNNKPELVTTTNTTHYMPSKLMTNETTTTSSSPSTSLPLDNDSPVPIFVFMLGRSLVSPWVAIIPWSYITKITPQLKTQEHVPIGSVHIYGRPLLPIAWYMMMELIPLVLYLKMCHTGRDGFLIVFCLHSHFIAKAMTRNTVWFLTAVVVVNAFAVYFEILTDERKPDVYLDALVATQAIATSALFDLRSKTTFTHTTTKIFRSSGSFRRAG
eukprot:PhF_6_TR39053/c0_g1_i1/m.58445